MSMMWGITDVGEVSGGVEDGVEDDGVAGVAVHLHMPGQGGGGATHSSIGNNLLPPQLLISVMDILEGVFFNIMSLKA